MGVPSVRFGVFIPSVERFDANAFGLSDVEAQLMDPQQRLLMECLAEALVQRGGVGSMPGSDADSALQASARCTCAGVLGKFL
jgi:hypothetical protein